MHLIHQLKLRRIRIRNLGFDYEARLSNQMVYWLTCLSVSDLYSEKLINEGTVTKEEVVAVIDKYEKICEDAYKKAAEETQTFHKHWLDSPWSGFFEGKDPLHVSDTGKALPFLFWGLNMK